MGVVNGEVGGSQIDGGGEVVRMARPRGDKKKIQQSVVTIGRREMGSRQSNALGEKNKRVKGQNGRDP